MEPPGIPDIKETFDKSNTEYLISIWLSNNRDEYRDEAFQALKELLLKRGVLLSHPGKPVRYNGKQFNPPEINHPPPPQEDLEFKPIPIDETLVTIDSCSNLTEAYLLESRLEAEGISVFLLGEHHIHLNWLISRAIGGIRVQVKGSDAARAREIVRLVRESQLEIKAENETVNCPNCGSSDIRLKRKTWKIAFLMFFLFQIPLPFRKNIAICNSCGHKWKSLEKIKEPPRKKTTKDKEEWVCSECGADVAVDATVCLKCGADVSDVEED